jgi:hypothetical protein
MTNNFNGKINCSICGSSNAFKSCTERHLPIPYGAPVLIRECIRSCPDCGAEIDETQDEDNKAALENGNRESIKSMIDYLCNDGYSLAQLERAHDLPQRTISRWRTSGDLSSVGTALLRILRTYPWITEVAENHFNEDFSKRILVKAAADEFIKIKQFADPISMGVGYVQVSRTEENINIFSIFAGTLSTKTESNIPQTQEQIGYEINEIK